MVRERRARKIMGKTIYKIMAGDLWSEALRLGKSTGAAIDRRDGFIHFSTAAQVEETARFHFAGQHGLLLVAFEAADFGADLKWEASRGGDLFPHLYAVLDPARAKWAVPLPWNGGSHGFPDGWRDDLGKGP